MVTWNVYLKKVCTCYNDLKKSSSTKITEDIASGYSLFTHCSFDATKNKLDYYRGKNCMKKCSKDLKNHATIIINYEKKEVISLTVEENNYIMNKIFVIYAKENLIQITMIKNIIKSEIIIITQENIEVLLIIFVM